MRVIVVGAGIIGANIAWHLSRAGAEVTVIDAGGAAASHTSFGWINASFYADSAHHRLRVAGMAAYDRLRARVDLAINRSGALWWEEQGAALLKMKRDLQALDYPVEYQSAAGLRTIEKNLTYYPNEALRFPLESAAEPALVAAQLLRDCGAKIIRGVRAQAVSHDPTITGVQTDMGHISADRVVVAAGTGSRAFLEPAGVTLPMLKRPGVLVTTSPIAARISHILVTPHGEVRQLPDGRILASAVANHQGDDASEVTETPDEIATRVLTWLEPLIGAPLTCDSISLAYRPMPADGLPVIGAVGPKGLYVAVMHSGVTLGAITGEATAAEVLGLGQEAYHDLLAPYRPARFQ